MLYVGFHGTVTDRKQTEENFLQVLLSNVFPQLRICTILDMGFFSINFNNVWTGSATLRTLNLRMTTLDGPEKLRSLCPRLRRLTTNRLSIDDASEKIWFPNATSQIKKTRW